MFFKSLVLLSLGAVTLATPASEPALGLTSRARNPCDGGRSYCGWLDRDARVAPQCKCPNGFSWSDRQHECRAPVFRKPRTGRREKAVCARDRKNYCDFDEREELCRNDGKNVVVVVEVDVEVTVLERGLEEECAKPKCPAGRSWDDDDQKCRFPSLPKEKASSCKRKGGRPICARTPEKFCDYGERESLCEDDGINCLQCLEERERDVKKVLKKSHAEVDVALEALGFDCLCNGIGCALNDTVWGVLGVVSGVGRIVGGILCGLLGCK